MQSNHRLTLRHTDKVKASRTGAGATLTLAGTVLPFGKARSHRHTYPRLRFFFRLVTKRSALPQDTGLAFPPRVRGVQEALPAALQQPRNQFSPTSHTQYCENPTV